MMKISINRLLDKLFYSTHGLKVLSFIQKHPLLLSNYFYFRRSFITEQQGVLAGQIAYHASSLDQGEPPIYGLRRNIHRIEKGLSAQNRRDLFATDYIGETVNFLSSLVGTYQATYNTSKIMSASIYWAVDVLSEYFEVVQRPAEIERAYLKFLSIVAKYNLVKGPKFPQYEIPIQPAVSYESILGLAKQRHSIRSFQPTSVPKELIDQAVMVALQSPSGCNRQAFEFLVLNDRALIEKVAAIPGGAATFAQNIPCLVVLVGKLYGYFHERDRHLIYIDGSLAAMAFLFGLETLGLSSCCINWPNLPEKDAEIENSLKLSINEKVIMMIAVGYSNKGLLIPYSAKRSIDEMRTYDN